MMHHLCLKRFLLPYSGPLTSDPAIGWLGINISLILLFLFIILIIFRFVEPVSVIIFFEDTIFCNFYYSTRLYEYRL